LNVADPNVIQNLLSREGQVKVEQTIAALPGPAHAQIQAAFTDYVIQARNIFAASVAHVFLISAVVGALALIATFTLKEIPLVARKRGAAAEEAGEELAVEMGQAEPDDEPILARKA
jgi:hypothetical protein